MILPGFPLFFAGGSASPPGDNLTAGAYSMLGVDGYVSSAFRSLFGDPGPDIGVLSPVPDPSKTWLVLGYVSTEDGLTVYLAGDQRGYMTGKALNIDADVYTPASPSYLEGYFPDGDVTAFRWLALSPIVDGNSYLVTIT